MVDVGSLVTYALFALGIPLLWKSADWLVQGATSIASHLGVSSLVVGLTVVSMGTSAPELAVNLLAAWRGSTDIAIGNVLGSNAANTLLILGTGALIYPLSVRRSTVRNEIPFSVVAALVVGVLANDLLWGRSSTVDARDGVVLLVLFVSFLAYVGFLARSQGTSVIPTSTRGRQRTLWAGAGLVAVGVAGLALASDWIVEGALVAAADLGVREGFIGFTIVAFGTSLPELAATVSAARKGESDVVVGNVVGSNVFNLLLVIGATSLVSPIPFRLEANIDLLVVILSAALVLFYFRGNRRLTRAKGASLVAFYVGYLVFLVIRG